AQKQEELIIGIAGIFQEVSTKYGVPFGDFPNPQKFAAIIKNWEIWKFPRLKPRQITAIDEMLEQGIPQLLEKVELKEDFTSSSNDEVGKRNWNPFSSINENDEDADAFDINNIGMRWIVSQQQKGIYDEKFFALETVQGKASGSQVKKIMQQTGLDNHILGKVWSLADLDKDGFMVKYLFAYIFIMIKKKKKKNLYMCIHIYNSEEFALCMYLLEEIKHGKTLPDQLSEEYIPPSFRKKQKQVKKNPFDASATNTSSTKNSQVSHVDKQDKKESHLDSNSKSLGSSHGPTKQESDNHNLSVKNSETSLMHEPDINDYNHEFIQTSKDTNKTEAGCSNSHTSEHELGEHGAS
ncbi:hypothetical protein RFI_10373, partial [Reticulomyxa filosa]